MDEHFPNIGRSSSQNSCKKRRRKNYNLETSQFGIPAALLLEWNVDDFSLLVVLLHSLTATGIFMNAERIPARKRVALLLMSISGRQTLSLKRLGSQYKNLSPPSVCCEEQGACGGGGIH